MAWDDIVFGVLTGGLYNVGKTVYKAGEAAEQAGDAVEEIADQAGNVLAIIGTTITELGREMNSFLEELEELLTVERITPRDPDELWDEEVVRYNALRQKEQELINELNTLGFTAGECAVLSQYSWIENLMDLIFGSGIFSGIFGGFGDSADLEKKKKGRAVCAKLAMVREAIREILYEEPGVLPQSIYYLKEILERFNTLEQPRIESIMDGTEDNLETFQEIQEEIKKLFVVSRWEPVSTSEMGADKLKELVRLEESKKHIGELMGRHLEIAKSVQSALVKVTPSDVFLPPIVSKKASDVTVATEPPVGTGTSGPAPGSTVGAMGSASIKSAAKISTGALAASWAKVQKQTPSQAIGSALKQSTVSAYLGNHNLLQARIRFFEREHLKIERAIFRIKWRRVEEPGVIPRILSETALSIERFRTEEQPRIEKILDSLNEATVRFNTEEQPRIEAILNSVNDTVVESRNLLSNANTSIDRMQGWVDFIASWRIPILIGAGLFGVLHVAIMIALLVVLVKIAFVL